MKREKVNVFWFRRDLRWEDNRGLAAALVAGLPVLPLFIFDRNILDRLADKDDPRVTYIWNSLQFMRVKAQAVGSDLHVMYGKPKDVWPRLLESWDVQAVFTNHDYEPYGVLRDREVGELLAAAGAELKTFKDQVIFEKSEVVKDDGKPYGVFTPYSRKWKANLQEKDLGPAPSLKGLDHLKKGRGAWVELEEMGFCPSKMEIPEPDVGKTLIQAYGRDRDFPAVRGTSHLGHALRFGTVSVRQMVKLAREHSDVWWNELIWREFFMQLLWHHPQTPQANFKKNFNIAWREAPAEFERWCQGATGYPLVDAGMRELNATGFMHNRVRMVTASFLCKHLLIDWKLGERYFARKLLDFDLASNVGNWQWVAGSGSDAAPFFRIFNPDSQAKKFDSKGEYIRRWVPEVGTSRYPAPMVEHTFARIRALAALKASS